MIDGLVAGPLAARAGAARAFKAVMFVTGRSESHVEEAAQPIYSRWTHEALPIETTILAAPSHAPSGSRYTKRDVEPLLKQARSRMQSKGILLADLPAPTQGLEKEATSAMADAEYGKAFLAASTFNQAVQDADRRIRRLLEKPTQ